MSLGGPVALPLDQATMQLIESGVHCIVAAGNEFGNAIDGSPARVKDAITVAAIDISDSVPSFSNTGVSVDVFAPGVDIISTWIDGKSAMMDGTSMATPHVAGLVAYYISTVGNKSPPEMGEYVKSSGLQGAVKGISPPTPNVLVHLQV